MTLGNRLARGAVLVAGFALATIVLGWWGVPLIAAAFGLIDRERSSAGEAAIGAFLAWAGLLAVAAARGDAVAVASRVGGAAGVPSVILPMLAVAFPAALAWSAAAVAALIAGFARRART